LRDEQGPIFYLTKEKGEKKLSVVTATHYSPPECEIVDFVLCINDNSVKTAGNLTILAVTNDAKFHASELVSDRDMLPLQLPYHFSLAQNFNLLAAKIYACPSSLLRELNSICNLPWASASKQQNWPLCGGIFRPVPPTQTVVVEFPTNSKSRILVTIYDSNMLCFWDATYCEFLQPLYVLDLSPFLNIAKTVDPTVMTTPIVSDTDNSNNQKSGKEREPLITVIEFCVHSRVLCVGFSTGDIFVFDFSMNARDGRQVSCYFENKKTPKIENFSQRQLQQSLQSPQTESQSMAPLTSQEQPQSQPQQQADNKREKSMKHTFDMQMLPGFQLCAYGKISGCVTALAWDPNMERLAVGNICGDLLLFDFANDQFNEMFVRNIAPTSHEAIRSLRFTQYYIEGKGSALLLVTCLEKRGVVVVNFGLSILSESIRHKNPSSFLFMELLDCRGNPLKVLTKVWEEKYRPLHHTKDSASNAPKSPERKDSFINKQSTEKFELGRTHEVNSKSEAAAPYTTSISTSSSSISTHSQPERISTSNFPIESMQEESMKNQKTNENKEIPKAVTISQTQPQTHEQQKATTTTPKYLLVARHNHLELHKFPTFERLSRVEPKNSQSHFIWCGVMNVPSQSSDTESCVVTIDTTLILRIYRLLNLDPLKKEFQLVTQFPFKIDPQHVTTTTYCPEDSTLWFFTAHNEVLVTSLFRETPKESQVQFYIPQANPFEKEKQKQGNLLWNWLSTSKNTKLNSDTLFSLPEKDAFSSRSDNEGTNNNNNNNNNNNKPKEETICQTKQLEKQKVQLGDLSETLQQNRQLLQERGERLNELSNKSQRLADLSTEFLQNVRKLSKKEKKWYDVF